MKIRETNKGKFQVLREDQDLSRAPVFSTREEAEAYILRPIPQWRLDEQALDERRAEYRERFATLLANPELREMRRGIQEAYGEACHQDKLAGAAQRAAVLGMGQISCMGRDIGAVRQERADSQYDEVSQAWRRWNSLCAAYEAEKQLRMEAAGIPVELFGL